jgi:lipopolysaccharide transport system permease protein
LVSNGSLVSKVYFPRLCVPIAAVVASFIDFLIGLVVLVPVMAGYQVWGGLRILLLPIFIVLAFAAALGFALWLAPVAVKYRDVRHVIPFMLQAWLFLTPVAYSTTLLDSGWRWVYALNPMVGIVEGFRWSLLGIDVAITGPALISAGIALTVLVGGALYFRRKERTLADVL